MFQKVVLLKVQQQLHDILKFLLRKRKYSTLNNKSSSALLNSQHVNDFLDRGVKSFFQYHSVMQMFL